MARGPDGTLAASAASEPDLSADQLAFLSGVEGIIDQVLARPRGGAGFVHGIHQGLTPAMKAALAARYRRAGWGEAQVRDLVTGGHLLVLHPARPDGD